ncbi:hypothetical protein CEUSTIGMA_g3603.t1 [Chlamydomonas eustigma]|uniref:Actin-related protein 2/3 complex subunit 4 n=1 Tax=Chlamydomonas eustigma TaxID=1157962 RepID=A0A250WZN9_9CHLO|nr:hypothetical protein CEUSTIGMA_g3603.t1 [Chlamydomonas eustigma]|eukprot:GAX76159.1 hypothetical protein CEUSTIGMA_g3603.t1 [Chlamydomonas eustigma]
MKSIDSDILAGKSQDFHPVIIAHQLEGALINALNQMLPEYEHSLPEVEVHELPHQPQTSEIIDCSCGGIKQNCLLEMSVNSVRMSFLFSHTPDFQSTLRKMLLRHMMQRADDLDILRRVPVQGYDISFLITAQHSKRLGADRLANFLLSFSGAVSASVTDMEKAIQLEGTASATDFLRGLAF